MWSWMYHILLKIWFRFSLESSVNLDGGELFILGMLKSTIALPQAPLRYCIASSSFALPKYSSVSVCLFRKQRTTVRCISLYL
jgi:hypothetical protein